MFNYTTISAKLMFCHFSVESVVFDGIFSLFKLEFVLWNDQMEKSFHGTDRAIAICKEIKLRLRNKEK